MRLQRVKGYALLAVLGHFVVNLAHGSAHSALEIPLTRSQELFIILVILVAPVLAAVLIGKESHRSGGLLLAVSLAASLVFGVYYHFVAVSPDHVSHLPATGTPAWKILFQATAVLLIPTEGFGCWAGVELLRRTS